jgi:hypothetical protein
MMDEGVMGITSNEGVYYVEHDWGLNLNYDEEDWGVSL